MTYTSTQSLVITVIVLLILAGVSIQMLTGENGILKRAGEARDRTDYASDLEYLKIEANAALMTYYSKAYNTLTEKEYVLSELSKISGITVNEARGKVTYNEKTFDISEIINNADRQTSEQKLLAENGLEEVTDSTLLEKDSVKYVVKETANASSQAVIPVGFYYVTGKPSTGLVISDVSGDDNTNTKGGNQFVWVPCGTNGANYKKHTYATTSVDDSSTTADTGNGEWKTYHYRKYNGSWSDTGNTSSVTTYGGFYIARYEAGLPTNNSLWANSNGATYGWTNGKVAGSMEGTRDTTTMIPVSKKNNASWNRISQTNAKTASTNMYSGSTSVISGLIDSYAWDTTTEWIASDTTNYPNIAKDSTNYGNYLNSAFPGLQSVLYAEHKFNYTNWSWVSYASTYTKGNLSITARSYSSGNNVSVYELATGSNEGTKQKNIYDMAGNMWEWTTETGNHGSGTTEYAVLRGGSFFLEGSDHPLSIRGGGNSTSYTSVFVGFRAMLST